MQQKIKSTFVSFGVRNYRLYFIGQGLSLCGTWMQTIALSWLVLQLTHSGTQLGLVTAAQFLPILVLGAWGGVIADLFEKRRVLFVTQSLYALVALALGLLVTTHHVQLWMVYALAACFGLVTVFDAPTRQAFIIEMVGPDKIRNAVTLNATIVNTARIVGPSIAGVLIAAASIGTCFIVNAFSYLALLAALALMDRNHLLPAERGERGPGQIKAGFDYVRQTPILRTTLLMMFIIGTFTYEFPVLLPLFATRTMHGNAGTYSAMMAAMGAGAIAGGFYTASHSRVTKRQLVLSAMAFGLLISTLAFMPNKASAYAVLVAVGVLSVIFISLGNSTLQLSSQPQMRGRVMSLWSISFQGTTPIGGPIVGLIADKSNPRVGLLVGGLAAVLAGIIGVYG